jgi:miniconductance mechanosensitive channel
MPIATNSIAASAVAAAEATPTAIAAGTPIPTAIPTPIPTLTPVPLPTPTAMFSGFQQATVARLQSAGGSEYIDRIYATFADWLGSLGVPDPWPAFISALCSLLILAAVGYGVFRLTAKLIPFLLSRILSHWSKDWARVFQEEKVLDRLAHVAPLALLAAAMPIMEVLGFDHLLILVIELYGLWILLTVTNAIIGLVLGLLQLRPEMRSMPLNTIEQASKLFIALIAILCALSVIFNRSPIYFLSGLGALTAVVVLVFRDTILGLVAGIVLALNDMVRVGDWIEINGTPVNGDVTSITLTTVRVQNFDRTTVHVPAYDLISKTVINWRGMVDSGGRRIKRSVQIDMNSIRFVDTEMLETFRKFTLLGDYLDSKIAEIDEWNVENKCDDHAEINIRRQTNVGVYRAYCAAYLHAHPKIHQLGFTFLVRHLQPTDSGLPIELYVFTNDNRWAQYEDIQADIFDHLLAAAPEFGLRVFQSPTGSDLREVRGTPINPA